MQTRYCRISDQVMDNPNLQDCRRRIAARQFLAWVIDLLMIRLIDQID